MITNYLWTERYRPRTVDDYVWRDEAQQQQVRQWVSERNIPHLLFSGGPGTGKTTLAKVLMNDLGVEEIGRAHV